MGRQLCCQASQFVVLFWLQSGAYKPVNQSWLLSKCLLSWNIFGFDSKVSYFLYSCILWLTLDYFICWFPPGVVLFPNIIIWIQHGWNIHSRSFTLTGDEKRSLSKLLLFLFISCVFHCTICIFQGHRLCLCRATSVGGRRWVSDVVYVCVCACARARVCFMLVCESFSTLFDQ